MHCGAMHCGWQPENVFPSAAWVSRKLALRFGFAKARSTRFQAAFGRAVSPRFSIPYSLYIRKHHGYRYFNRGRRPCRFGVCAAV